MKAGTQVIEKVARLGGFEPPTSGSGDQHQIYILLVRSVLSRTSAYATVPYSAVIFPKSFHNFSSRVFERGLPIRTHLSSLARLPLGSWLHG